ncbi:MAG: tRNA (adenosine(37)-N6)-threonylcarbamoyltransferase complex ATPase subunit type 1 TsaE [Acidimicrobiia bacterium]|nr:tRNA (adenosine(37)-N6)-threonylcarbamoyltransferase complex ATPase subunit type 1 TsaE [Acidimicrobiia bacterium]
MTTVVTSNSPDETLRLGRRLAALLTAGDVVLLTGPLGAGKTLFVSGVAEGLGIAERITSPTFLIARVYRDGFLPLVHADVYRLGSMAEFDDLGILDDGADGAVVIEWGEAVADAIPEDRLVIRFSADGETRRITLEPEGTWCERDLGVVA